MAAGTNAESREALLAAVSGSARLRRPYDVARDRGPFVIAGVEDEWSAAFDRLRADGHSVVAFYDPTHRSRKLLHRGRPVWRGSTLGPFAKNCTVYLAGRVHKRYFSGVPDAMNRCVYGVPLDPHREGFRADPRLTAKRGNELAEVFAMLSDESSRQSYASLVRGREATDAGYFSVAPYVEYQHPRVRGVPGDVVLDVGAFTGATAWRFAWQLKGRGRIVALEPVMANYGRLARRRIPGLLPLCVGAWNEDTTLTFDEKGSSSRVSEGGSSRLHVCRLDDLVRRLALPRVDLIKLDIEGAERQALEGAAEIIAEHRPKLQVSIYHRNADLYELPLLIRSMVRGPYEFFVGHHGPYHTETDLYALPL